MAQIVAMIQENAGEAWKELGGGRGQIVVDAIDVGTFKKIN